MAQRWNVGVIARLNSRQTLRFVTPSLHYSCIACFSIVCLDTNHAAAETKIWETFSGEKALAHVQRLVDLGPRPAGSEALEKSRRYIEDQLRHSGWEVKRQAFTDDTPRGKIHFVNLIAQFPGETRSGIAIVLILLALRHQII